jgi:hypothetical protein
LTRGQKKAHSTKNGELQMTIIQKIEAVAPSQDTLQPTQSKLADLSQALCLIVLFLCWRLASIALGHICSYHDSKCTRRSLCVNCAGHELDGRYEVLDNHAATGATRPACKPSFAAPPPP